MGDDPRRHHGPLEEIEEAIVEFERRVIRLGRMQIPLPKIRKRWLAAGAGVFLLVLVGAFLALTRTALTKTLVLPAVAGLLAADAEAERVVIEPDGRLVVTGLSLTAPGVEGPAGEFFRAARLEARLRWGALLGGEVVVDRLTLDRPVVTVSQHRDTGRLNIGGLAVMSGKPSAGAPVIPEITTRDAEIVFGEHDGPEMTVLRRLALDGETSGLRRDGSAYDITLREVAPDSGRDPLLLTGRLDADGLELILDQVTLEQWGADAAPQRVRGFWEALRVEGAIAETRLRYRPDGRVRLAVRVDDVALTLPVGEGGDGPRMAGVAGEIVFTNEGVETDLRGALDGVPFRVEMAYTGFSPDAPFEATLVTEDYWLEGQPEILRFAPGVVRRRLGSFGFPSALVDATVRLRRGADDRGLKYEGEIAFEDGVAAYEYFPYVFEDLVGRFRFNNEGLWIEGVRGVASTGARISAEGVIAPPTPGAAVDLRVIADGVPVDEALVQALGEHRRALVRALFNEDQYAALLEAGLVLRPEDASALASARDEASALLASGVGPDEAARLRERVAQLERALETPAFEPGGTARVEVTLLRALGDDSEWDRTIAIRLPEAGLLPEQFPLPIVGRDLSIIIKGDDLRLGGGRYRALRGGEASVSAVVELGNDAEGNPKPFEPVITIEARGAPIDDLFIHALPGPRDRRTAERGASVQQMLTDLRLEGVADCTALIAPRPGKGRGTEGLGFDVHARFEGLSARPAARFADERIAIDGLRGDVRVSERTLHLSLVGDARPGDALPDPVLGLRRLGRVELSADVTFPREDEASPVFAAFVQGTEVDLRGPFEDLVAVFSPEAARTIADLRAARSPEGVVALRSELRGGSDGRVRVRIGLRDMERLSFDAVGGRVSLGETTGSLTLTAGAGGRLRFDAFGAPVSFNGEPAGVVRLSGETPVGPLAEQDETLASAVLDVTLEGARFESRLLDAVIRERIGGELAGLYGTVRPSGGFDLELTATPQPAGAHAEASVPLRMAGLLRPRSFALTLGEERVRFGSASGLVEFDEDSGAFTGMSATGEGWSLRGDGAWSRGEAGAFRVDAAFEAASDGLAPGMLACLPDALADALADLEVTAGGGLRVEEATLGVWREGGERGWAFASDGRVAFERLGLIAGVEVAEASGSLAYEAGRARGSGPAGFVLRVSGEEAVVSGVRMTGLRVRAESGIGAGTVILPLLAADCHGGRVSGQARSAPAKAGGPGGENGGDESAAVYEATVQASGVRLAPVLRDLALASGEAPEAGASAEGGDLARGVVDGRLGLTGRTGARPMRQGSGYLQASGGRVLDLPLVLPLIEVSNLALPTGEQLDYGRASFLVEGDRVTFEELSLFSGSVEILGFGEMDWLTKGLDLRFNSRASRRIPIVSDVLEGVRDELISTEVRGTLREPKVSVTQLSGTRRALGRLFGEPTERERRMEEIERRAREAREAERGTTPRRPARDRQVDGSE